MTTTPDAPTLAEKMPQLTDEQRADAREAWNRCDRELGDTDLDCDAYAIAYAVFAAGYAAGQQEARREVPRWQHVDCAPKDGRLVFLAAADGNCIAIGKWNEDGDSWVDENGQLGRECVRLAVTGSWDSGTGWFQPDEVMWWHPLPPIGAAIAKLTAAAALPPPPAAQGDSP